MLSREHGVAVKACGLAKGKGVVVCPEPYQAVKPLEEMMGQKIFGSAGDSVLIEEMLDFVDDVVDELGSRDEIERIRDILNEGTGADRQLAVFKETKDLKKVVDFYIEETKRGLT